MTTATWRSDPPTDTQLNYLYRLAGDKLVPSLGSCEEERIENMGARVENESDRGTLTKGLVSTWIEWLISRPDDETEKPKQVRPGVFKVGDDVFVVKPTRDTSSLPADQQRLYAKRMVEINSERATEAGTHVKIEFVYAPGAVFNIREENRLPFDKARALSIRYGRCINCGRHLKAAKSVDEGIGPVCRKAFG